MQEPLSQHCYIVLGRYILCLENWPRGSLPHALEETIKGFRNALKQCGATNTLAVSDPLANVIIQFDKLTGTVTEQSGNEVRLLLAPIRASLENETKRKLMIELRTSDVTSHLRELPEHLELNNPQKLLLAETCRCVEVGAYRAANVMAWSLAFDYIRQWVFDNQLVQFNQALTTQYQKNHPDPIVEYEEFLTRDNLGEYVVLDAMKGAKIIRGKLFDQLNHYLRERNKYAHPNFAEPTVSKTNSYIQHLIEIILGEPFRGQ